MRSNLSPGSGKVGQFAISRWEPAGSLMVGVESLCDGQQRRARRESVAATARRARASDLRSGESLGGNATAFGYSVTITASFGAVELGRGTPRFGDLTVFGLGAVVAFGGLEGLASGGFRSPLQKGLNEVVLLGTALAFISIVLAIVTARGIAEVLSGAWAWFGAEQYDLPLGDPTPRSLVRFDRLAAAFDMSDSSEIPPAAEPFFIGLNAKITFAPVMNADEMRAGVGKAMEAA